MARYLSCMPSRLSACSPFDPAVDCSIIDKPLVNSHTHEYTLSKQDMGLHKTIVDDHLLDLYGR